MLNYCNFIRSSVLNYARDFQTLSVEFNHVKVGKEGLKKILEKKGYVLVGEVTNPQGLANDFIFVHYTLPNLIAAAKE